jgi:hypothetical protein
MRTSFTWWKGGDHFVGYLDEYPDYETQGETLEDLKEHLLDLYRDVSAGSVPGVRHRGELMIP